MFLQLLRIVACGCAVAHGGTAAAGTLAGPYVGAVERVVASGKNRTPDLGGSAKTKDLADAIASEI